MIIQLTPFLVQTDYDLALLFVDGYVVTDPSDDDYGNFTLDDTSNLNLWDADQNILDRIEIIRQTSDCSALLAELHSACSPFEDNGCSATNLQSYQVSVDDVCDAINTDVKLFFGSIFTELDGYASDDGEKTLSFVTLLYRETKRAFPP